ncbi:type IV pilus assembly protein PilM [Patescibacteria group bacterium]|nr:type IV pilus assembly protein PilM [Patescibacteria group bacterium]MBU4022831.1 type IV pilus assembly protein PilM [Patescibacteria group bacterium]MBU4078432.1 type IV pilus assembly protein PilM [Patescibacteria group bacterium]
MALFNAFSKSFIGVDIGADSVKLVELSKQKGKMLTNYGILGAEYFAGNSFRNRERGVLSIEEDNIVGAITSILQEAGIKSKQAFFSIPDYVSFFTTFDLPPMSEKEVPEAVKYEAPRRIPLPLSEVTLDWQIIKGGPNQKGATPLRVLLVTVPNDVIAKYQRIAQGAGLKIIALEAEVFAMLRALIKYQDKSNVIGLIDIGERSSTINIVSQGVLKVSHSLDVSGEDFTRALTSALGIEKKKASAIIHIYGLSDKNPDIKKLLLPIAELILKKTKDIFNELYAKDKEVPGKIILSGGGVAMPGLVEYFAQNLDIPIEIANPFIDISAPPSLEETLKKIGPSLSIAAGMALRGFN